MHRNTSFDVSTTKIGYYLLVVIGIEGEKKRGKRGESEIQRFSPDCHFDPFHPIVINFGKVGGIKRAKFGVDRLRGAGSAGS